MAYHLFYNIISETHEIWDDEKLEKMKETFEFAEYKEEKNREYTLKEMELILKIEHLKYLVYRYNEAKERTKETGLPKAKEFRDPMSPDPYVIMTRARYVLFKEIEEMDINDFL